MRKHIRVYAVLTVIFAVLLIGGCINSSEQQAGGYQITDVEGTVVTFAHKPQRILTVSAGTDELMLGLVEPERMAAINESLADRAHTNIPRGCDRRRRAYGPRGGVKEP